MPMKQNSVWRFFASVKLALITLLVLAVVSIAGTVIKQGQDSSFYIQEYGESLARFFEATGITGMYTSWWFVALLGLFALNLVVCSIERLPGVWRQVSADPLAVDRSKIAGMGMAHRVSTNASMTEAAGEIRNVLRSCGWKKFCQADGESALLFAAQQNAWSRLGVYVVHLSILVILVGAMAGALFGFQAYVFIPEGKATEHVFLRQTKEPYPLGFKLRNDKFTKTFYSNGMVKQYHADLAVMDEQLSEPYRKTIFVNEPLSYAGLTFYVGDAYPTEAFYLIIRDQSTGKEQAFRAPAQQDIPWQGTDVSIRIEELQRDPDNILQQAKIRFGDGRQPPVTFWMEDGATVTLPEPYQQYVLAMRELQSVLLLVTRDPGLWIVYSGFVIMLAGLAMSFFLAHKRLWLEVESDRHQGCRILVAGTSNKHKPAFEKQFADFVEHLEKRLATEKGQKKRAGRKKGSHT